MSLSLYTDMNECALGNGGCDHQCVNTGGSFSCGCRPGYKLQADSHSCRLEGVCVCVCWRKCTACITHYTIYSLLLYNNYVEEPCCTYMLNMDG